jgi:hypothetical protein
VKKGPSQFPTVEQKLPVNSSQGEGGELQLHKVVLSGL